MSYLRQKLIEARKSAGLSQHKLATAIGWTQDNYNKIETGKRSISDGTLQKLANIPELGLTLNQLQCWKLIDEYPPELIEMAQRMIEEQK